MGEKFKICLAGSTRFKDEIKKIEQEFLSKNFIVFTPFFIKPGVTFTEKDIEFFIKMWQQNATNAHIVCVVNVYGYIGDHTKNDIKFAKSINKPIYYYYPSGNNNKCFNCGNTYDKDSIDCIYIEYESLNKININGDRDLASIYDKCPHCHATNKEYSLDIPLKFNK